MRLRQDCSLGGWGLAIVFSIGLVSRAENCAGSDSSATAPVTTQSISDVPPVELPTVVVTAPAQPLTAPGLADAAQERTKIPGAVTLTDPAEMNRGRASSFEDLLRGTPGVTLQSENGTEVSKVSVRGSGILSEDEPLGVQFLLDGFTYNQADGEVILEDFDVDTIKYAEVFRGAAGFKYGAITLGGAVNLVSMTGYDADPFHFRVEGGSYGFVRSQVSSGGVSGPLDYYVSVEARHRDGFRDQSRENTQIFVGNLGYRINDHLENRVYLTLDDTSRNLPGGLTKDQMNANPKQADPFSIAQNWNKMWTYARVADKLSFKSDRDTADAGFYVWHRDLQNRGFYSPDFPAGTDRFYAYNYGLLFDLSHQDVLFGKKNLLSVGFSPSLETQAAQNFQNLDGVRGATTAHHSELSINAPFYAEDQQYVTDHFSVVAGIQAIYAQRQFHNLLPGNQGNDDHANLKYYGLNPKFGVVYELDNETQVYANVSRSWQPPSFDNMLDFGDGPNPQLEFTQLSAEHAWTVEVGTRGHRGRFEWDLSLYRSWVRDELLQVNDAQGNDRGAVNIDKSIHQGIEVGLEIELLDSVILKKNKEVAADTLTFAQSYTFNDIRFDSDPVYHDNRIAGIPIHVYQAELLYQTPSGFYAGPTMQWNVTHYPVDHSNTLSADPYFLLGFRVGYRAKNGLTAFFEARNLLDEHYASSIDPVPDARIGGSPAIFHPGDGRSFYAGVSWSF